jgi:DNA repair exonuclease SbcCD ATPase subunit
MSTLEELRARLESAEAARRDAQESRFAMIIENEELGADLADLRGRLESAEAALRRLQRYHTIRTGDWLRKCSLCGLPISKGRHGNDCPFAALGAAGERSEG